jgi:hypothetical protein
MFQSLLGNMERRLYRPTHPLFGQAHLFYSECLSVGCSGVLLVGTPEANVSANGNQGRPSGFFTGLLECECDRSDVVAPLHSLHVPAESVEPLQTVFGEREFRAAFDGDVVVGIKNDEFAQMLVTRIRTSLGRNTLLKISIADENIGIVVHDPVTGPIESRCERHLGNGHADCVGQALPQWPSGRLNARSLAVFRMPRRATAPLAKPLEFLHWQVESCDMEQRVQQRTPVSG